MKKKIIPILIINVLITFLLGMFNYNVKAVTQTINTDISKIDTVKYPGIKEKIEALKKSHPNWNFKILYTGIEWSDAIKYEYTGHGSSPKNLVPASSSYSGEWICSICGNKAYDSGSWRCASESAIKYMMDPRTSLNTSDIFQFLQLSYDFNGYSKEVMQTMLKDSFLDNSIYIDTILEACKKYNVNPYYIIARIIQEQGKNGSTLVRGQGYKDQYVGYYNVFNIGATGSGTEKVILNGLAKAQNYGWNTMELALEGGIKIIAQTYIAVGQDTMYFQKFDVENSDGKLYWHQYMQNIMAAQSEGATLKKTLTNINALDYKYTFIIPVYENMPKTAISRPSTTKTTNSVNSDLVKVNVTSSIKMRNEPNGASIVGYLYKDEIATRIEKASAKVNGTYWDKVLKGNGTIGYVARCTYDFESTYKEYLVALSSSANATNVNDTNTITNNTNTADSGNTTNNDTTNRATGNTAVNTTNTATGNSSRNTNNTSLGNTTTNTTNISPSTTTSTNDTSNSNAVSGTNTVTIYKKGDINMDGKRDSADLLYLKKYLLNKVNLTNVQKNIADTNNDNKIDSADLLNIKRFLLGKITL